MQMHFNPPIIVSDGDLVVPVAPCHVGVGGMLEWTNHR